MFNLSFNGLKEKEISAVIDGIKRQKKVLISDTTLRDGEQAPRAALNVEQKLIIAKQLEKVGVDSIEVGFPASSKEDFYAARIISGKVRRPLISALSRCREDDISSDDAIRQLSKIASMLGIDISGKESALRRLLALKDSYETGRYAESRAVDVGNHFMNVDGAWDFAIWSIPWEDMRSSELKGTKPPTMRLHFADCGVLGDKLHYHYRDNEHKEHVKEMPIKQCKFYKGNNI